MPEPPNVLSGDDFRVEVNSLPNGKTELAVTTKAGQLLPDDAMLDRFVRKVLVPRLGARHPITKTMEIGDEENRILVICLGRMDEGDAASVQHEVTTAFRDQRYFATKGSVVPATTRRLSALPTVAAVA